MNDSIEQYFKTVPENARPQLNALRDIVKTELPDAEEVISYAILGYRLKNKILVYCAGWKKHVSVYPIPEGDPEFQAAIAPYKKGRGTLQFSLDAPLPEELIRQLVCNHVAARIK